MTPTDISRRRFLQVSGVAAAAGLTGTTESTTADGIVAHVARKQPTTVNVCVIGAGFGGLAAAHAIRRAGKSVIVLEARDRVGGSRVHDSPA